MKNPVRAYASWLEKMALSDDFLDYAAGGFSFMGIVFLFVVIVFAIGAALVAPGPCVDWKQERCLDASGAIHDCRGACLRHQGEAP